jgi:hypothetical protein
MHGWAISERIQQISRDVLPVTQESLDPALHRLEHQQLDPSRNRPYPNWGAVPASTA